MYVGEDLGKSKENIPGKYIEDIKFAWLTSQPHSTSGGGGGGGSRECNINSWLFYLDQRSKVFFDKKKTR